jgi:hypothetical protein
MIDAPHQVLEIAWIIWKGRVRPASVKGDVRFPRDNIEAVMKRGRIESCFCPIAPSKPTSVGKSRGPSPWSRE